MNQSEFPILRLELQASKLTLMKALDDRHEDLQKMVAGAMDRALPHIGAQIDEQMEQAVKEAIARALRTAADEAVEKLSDDLVKRLGDKLTAAIRKGVK